MGDGRAVVAGSGSVMGPLRVPWELVLDAWEWVKANPDAAGVDQGSIVEFESWLEGNLRKVWRRISLGIYVSPEVGLMRVSKRDGRGVRVRGDRTFAPASKVAYSVARKAEKLYLEANSR